MELNTHITNVKLIDDLSAEFRSGNVYFVRGSNNRGKTTFVNSILSLLNGTTAKDAVTTGKENGEVEGVITGMDGKTYKVIINHKPDKLPTFTIIYPDLHKSSRKGDLESIFRYEAVNTETFAGWGLTEPGRRQQAEMFMKLMPIAVRAEINEIEQKIDTRNGSIYIARRDKGNSIKFLKQNGVAEPTQEQFDIHDQAENWKQLLVTVEQTVKAERAEKEKAERANFVRNQNLASLNNEAERLKARLLEIEKEIKSLPEEVQCSFTEEYLEEREQSIKRDQDAIYEAEKAAESIQKYNEYANRLLKEEEEYEALNKQLDNLRDRKEKLVEENLKMPYVSIKDGQLLFKDKTGEFPINEQSLSYSKIALLVADLVLKLNPNYPIVCLGKAAEFDDKSLDQLVNYAKKTDSIIVLDYVDNSGELKINVYEKEN